MFRHCFRAQYKDAKVLEAIEGLAPHLESLLKEDKLFSATAFEYDAGNLFFYWECPWTGDLGIEDVFPGLSPYLYPWPGEAEPVYYRPLLECYHSYAPAPDEEPAWKRTAHAEPRGMMSVMVPELMSSYIFWHYQSQEERPGDNGMDLTIWFDGNLAILYTEPPKRRIANPRPGKLSTNHTPDDWNDYIDLDFIPFPDGELYHLARVILTRSHGDL